MGLFSETAGEAQFQANQAAHHASPWVEWLARLGYAAKGVVYVLIGVIAVDAALTAGSGDQATGGSGALQSIADESWGQIVLGIIAVGLFGYVLWRLVQSLLDPEHKGTDMKGVATRIGYFISGALYATLALEAARLALGSGGGGGGGTGGSGGGSSASHWTSRVFELPMGVWLVGAAGVGIFIFGLYELYKAWTTDFSDRLHIEEIDYHKRQWIQRAGRAGLAARGVVFLLSGVFVVRAALQYDASEAQGLEGALQALERQPYGPWLLGLVALGLIGYGLFQLVKARYRHIKPA